MSAVNKLAVFNADNDDGQKSQANRNHCAYNCLRRSSRILLTLAATILTIFVCIVSSEEYFKYWVQTTIERTDVHVSEVAFPAMTICINPISLESIKNTDGTRLGKLSNLIHNVLWRTRKGVQATAEDFEEFNDFSNYPLDKLHNLFQLKFKCEDVFKQCTWRHAVKDCCTLLRRSSSKNTCFAFNSIFVEDPVSTWPWSVAGSGFGSALNVKINRHVHKHRVNSVGVIIHEPGQYLGSSVLLSPDDRIVFPLQPLRFTADLAVRARPAEMRRCFFPDEKRQSRSECINVCHINYISEKCNCNFVLPMAIKRDSDNTTTKRICAYKDLPCFQKHRLSVFSMSNIIEESTENTFNTTDCKCYPNCDHIQYHAATYTDRGYTEHNGSYVEVDAFFQEETLFSYRSTLYITFVDLMVSYGGIAGLFLGISLVGGMNALLDRISCCSKPTPKAS